ncbi:MAG: hypothetical protein J3K34DRAFT_417996 [Monoraphidium minutum]|nr:MAG: hypothetical protein J3K34DRAFT_417996 [Monoraphidium minutum]
MEHRMLECSCSRSLDEDALLPAVLRAMVSGHERLDFLGSSILCALRCCIGDDALLRRWAHDPHVLDAMEAAAQQSTSEYLPLALMQDIAMCSSECAARVAGTERVLQTLAALAMPDYGKTNSEGDDPHKNCTSRTAQDLLCGALLSAVPPAAAAMAAAFAPQLTSADPALRERAREFLEDEPLSIPALVLDAFEIMARQAAAQAAAQAAEAARLRAEVAELRAIPVNTRAAIVELAGALRRSGA